MCHVPQCLVTQIARHAKAIKLHIVAKTNEKKTKEIIPQSILRSKPLPLPQSERERDNKISQFNIFSFDKTRLADINCNIFKLAEPNTSEAITNSRTSCTMKQLRHREGVKEKKKSFHSIEMMKLFL